MSETANQAYFTLSLEGDDPRFQVLAFTGQEAISQPFSFTLELVSEQDDLDLERLLNRPAFQYNSSYAKPDFSKTNQPFWANEETYGVSSDE